MNKKTVYPKAEDDRLVTTFMTDGQVMFDKANKVARFSIDFEGDQVFVRETPCETESESVSWAEGLDVDSLRDELLNGSDES